MRIQIVGALNDKAELPEVPVQAIDHLTIDFQDLTSINSLGISQWITWIRKTAELTKITFVNCPVILIEQINMVPAIFPTNAQVDSFYVPFFSEASEEETWVLLQRGREFDQNGVHIPEVRDSNGNIMEVDILESKYFKFLEKNTAT